MENRTTEPVGKSRALAFLYLALLLAGLPVGAAAAQAPRGVDSAPLGKFFDAISARRVTHVDYLEQDLTFVWSTHSGSFRTAVPEGYESLVKSELRKIDVPTETLRSGVRLGRRLAIVFALLVFFLVIGVFPIAVLVQVVADSAAAARERVLWIAGLILIPFVTVPLYLFRRPVSKRFYIAFTSTGAIVAAYCAFVAVTADRLTTVFSVSVAR